MRTSRYIFILLLLVGIVACHYRPVASVGNPSDGEADSLSVAVPERAYALSSNFEVEADTLWLHLLPFMDTLPVVKGNRLVVAEFEVHPQDSVDSIWVKVARDQETIGWIQEHKLLEGVVPLYPPVQQFAYAAFLSGAGSIFPLVCGPCGKEEANQAHRAERYRQCVSTHFVPADGCVCYLIQQHAALRSRNMGALLLRPYAESV